MDEHIRVSDADRERIADRLREHFAEGRISSDELDERIAATLTAKTAGDLRWVTADLPGPATVAPPAPPAPRGRPRTAVVRRRPRIMPLLLIGLIVAVAVSGAGSVLVVFAKVVLAFFLIVVVAGIFAAVRFGWRLRRILRDSGRQWQALQWHAHQGQRHQSRAGQWHQWRRQQWPDW
jgi:hypothetical protein